MCMFIELHNISRSFGQNQALTIEEVDSFDDKIIQYTSDLNLTW